MSINQVPTKQFFLSLTTFESYPITKILLHELQEHQKVTCHKTDQIL